MTTKILKVMLWGREVGRLCIDSRRHLPYFEYNREWIESGLDISHFFFKINIRRNY